ncbi:hypothetical protein Nm8I071_67630 [Nonomuraea sp. TT08I-71]|nr:hypothetical protein Nm8I071_67630 [Nonomuraea sp. TT08I-71]
MDDDLAAHARELIEANRYLTLGTVDAGGRPWTSPVYFTADDELRMFYWVSTETSQHSLNLAARPDVSLVVFDSTVPPYHGRCLYAVGTAKRLGGDDVRRGLAVYPGPESRGGSSMTVRDVTGSTPWRLFGARVSALWALCPREPRRPCERHGRADDHRQQIR